MKRTNLMKPLMACFLTAGWACSSIAQTAIDSSIPVVSMVAADPLATWSGNPGSILIIRNGNPDPALNVYCCISGTASNGVDYQSIGNFVQLPSGVMTNQVVIHPINLGQTDIKTVTLEFCPSPLMTPINYAVGNPACATVYIAPTNHANLPPEVRILNPPNHAVFFQPAHIPLVAFAHDFDGVVTNVEFFANDTDLGTGRRLEVVVMPMSGVVSNARPVLPPIPFGCDHFLLWTNVSAGNYKLTAVATDDLGASTTSAPVNITVMVPPPPPTNRPAVVSLVAVDPIAVEGTNCWTWIGLTNGTPTWSNWSAASTCVFTNCGPNNAVFEVRRWGDLSNELNVAYDIGGTASNGVDYVTLSGTVTLHPGQHHAAILVVPIDDGHPDVNKTVVLKLSPSTNVPPDYVLGLQSKAAAVIVDRQWPRPGPIVLPDRLFHLNAAGPDGTWFSIEYSTDMVIWKAICTNQVIQGWIDVVDHDAPADVRRFYRTVPQAGPPPQ
jgi:hypothetical protein